MDTSKDISSILPTDLVKKIKTPTVPKNVKDQYKHIVAKENKLKSLLGKASDNANKVNINLGKEKKKKILGNASKTILPALAMVLTDKLTRSIDFNSQLEDMVEEVNEIIDAATTKEEINHSSLLRNRALTTINNNEQNVSNIRNDIQLLNTYVTIFNVIINVITLLPTPVAVPPGIGVPMSLVMKLVAKLNQASEIVSGVNVVLSIILPILDRIISELEDLKNQLHQINTLIDNKSLDDLTPEEFQEVVESIRNNPNEFPEYKGYKFKLKEENNIENQVKGNKRHYAVAINSQNVEVYKSEYSFTLDPDVLISQLKLKIDQQK